MVYGDFTLEKVKTAFELQILEDIDLFEEIDSITPTEQLRLTLEETAVVVFRKGWRKIIMDEGSSQ